MYRGLARGRTWNALHKAKLFKHALVECTLRLATVFIILVIELQAVPVLVELLQAVVTHLIDEVCRTPCDFAALFQTMTRIPVLRLAEHEVLIVILTICPDEERSALQRPARRAKFIDLGHRGGKRCGVLERLGRGRCVVESAHRSS